MSQFNLPPTSQVNNTARAVKSNLMPVYHTSTPLEPSWCRQHNDFGDVLLMIQTGCICACSQLLLMLHSSPQGVPSSNLETDQKQVEWVTDVTKGTHTSPWLVTTSPRPPHRPLFWSPIQTQARSDKVVVLRTQWSTGGCKQGANQAVPAYL